LPDSSPVGVTGAPNIPYFPSLLYFAAVTFCSPADRDGSGLSNSSTYFIGFAMTGLAAGVILNVIGLDVGNDSIILAPIVPGFLFVTAVPGACGLVEVRFVDCDQRVTLIPSVHLKDVVFWSTIALRSLGVERRLDHGGRNRRCTAQHSARGDSGRPSL